VKIEICTDPARLDVDAIHAFLTRSYWAAGVTRERVARALARALCFGLYADGAQIGFARVVTDGVTFGYLCDVYVLEAHRGLGLGKRLVEAVRAHPDLQGLRRLLLKTLDAHGLYEQFGFARVEDGRNFMQIRGEAP